MAINLISFILPFISLIIISPSQAHEKSVTIELIHRDSPLSPFHNPSLTKWDILGNSFNRSIARINRFKQSPRSISPNDIASKVSSALGEYIMELSIGTPPVKQLAIVDTGSDLIWIQCQPCTHCYNQDLPIFNPKNSSTYKVLPCPSYDCKSYLDTTECSPNGSCRYEYSYGDKSYTKGNLATETLTFESDGRQKTVSLDKVFFGCGYENGGSFRKEGSGLVGLGGGALSFVSQLSSSLGGKFSYCLIPFFQQKNATSKLYFGKKGEVSGSGVISTPLLRGNPDTFYFLTLESISVGEKTLSYKRSTTQQAEETDQGNIIIDSGTTLTFLYPDMLSDLESALEGYIEGTRVNDPQQTLNLCYKISKDLNIPSIIAHFTGADLELKPINTFIQTGEDVVCLAMMPTEFNDVAIFGNVAQANYLVGYDIEEGKVSFKPTDCSKE